MSDLRIPFGEMLTNQARKDKNIISLIGDIGYGVFDKYKQEFPDRLHNMGICEQSMIGVASGLALEGFKVYVYSITPFILERAFEQIKLDIDQQNVNVVLVGYADFPMDGPTHANVDLNLYSKLFKNIKFYFPNTIEELEFAFKDSYKRKGPSFIRLRRI